MHDRAEERLSEHQLIRQAAAGDQRAFESLLRRHDRRVLLLALRLTGSPEDAKDIYQEVFLRVYTGLAGFREQSAFATWIHRITINVCMSHLASRRKNAQGADRTKEDVGENIAEPSREAPAPEQRLLDAERRERLNLALQALPPQQRLVFTLRHHEGFKLREIASLVGCRLGTVKRYLFEATRTMRDQLQDLV